MVNSICLPEFVLFSSFDWMTSYEWLYLTTTKIQKGWDDCQFVINYFVSHEKPSLSDVSSLNWRTPSKLHCHQHLYTVVNHECCARLKNIFIHSWLHIHHHTQSDSSWNLIASKWQKTQSLPFIVLSFNQESNLDTGTIPPWCFHTHLRNSPSSCSTDIYIYSYLLVLSATPVIHQFKHENSVRWSFKKKCWIWKLSSSPIQRTY